MGRQLMRVPLDFDWPLNEIWVGYVNPHYGRSRDCECEGGYSPQAGRMADQWYGKAPFNPVAYGAKPLRLDDPVLRAAVERKVQWEVKREGLHRSYYTSYGTIPLHEAIDHEVYRMWNIHRDQWGHHLIQADVDALLEADRLWDFTRVPRTPEQRKTVEEKIAAGGNSWLPEPNGHHPTADEVNAWSLDGFGHDAINRGVCVEARCKREGVPYLCAVCDGEGCIWESPEAKQAAEDWEDQEPPVGPGYQLWETVSEGSPISPVFEQPEDLARWLVANPWGIDRGTTYDQWMTFITGDGWAPSMAITGGVVKTGVQAVADATEE